MNERFAAEPATCDSAFELKHLLEKFGPATGRYLATYPSRAWEQLLYAHASAWSDLDQERAKTLLRRAKETRALVRRSDVPYAEQDTWLENVARAQECTSRFDGVVVSRPNAGTFPSLDELDLPPTAAERVPAKSAEYVRVSRMLLMVSPEIHFVDAYLDPCDRDRGAVLHDLLRVAVAGRCQAALVWVREDCLKRSLAEAVSTLKGIARKAGFVAPRMLHLRAFTDAKRDIKVHDRYLLSLYGAIRFEHGFQELTGRRTANIVPESSRSHLQLVSVFFEGANDLGIEELAIDLS